MKMNIKDYILHNLLVELILSQYGSLPRDFSEKLQYLLKYTNYKKPNFYTLYILISIQT